MSGGHGHSDGHGGHGHGGGETIIDLPGKILQKGFNKAASAMSQVTTAVSRILSGLFMFGGGGGGGHHDDHAHGHH